MLIEEIITLLKDIESRIAQCDTDFGVCKDGPDCNVCIGSKAAKTEMEYISQRLCDFVGIERQQIKEWLEDGTPITVVLR